jgi:hypothetical protein
VHALRPDGRPLDAQLGVSSTPAGTRLATQRGRTRPITKEGLYCLQGSLADPRHIPAPLVAAEQADNPEQANEHDDQGNRDDRSEPGSCTSATEKHRPTLSLRRWGRPDA